MDSLGRLLIAAGAVLVVLGLVLVAAPRLPWLGRLPGDIAVEREHWRLYAPLGTCLLLSLVLSALVWILRR